MVQWKALNQKNVSKTFYFNLTKYEIAGEMKLEEIHARFQRFQDEVVNSTPADQPRDMTQPEIREMLDMIKVIVRYAYGEYKETPDGGELWKEQQDPHVWHRFVASGGFDAFIWYLFEDENRANSFMTNIWPEEYRQGVLQAQKDEGRPTPEDVVDDGIPTITAVPSIATDESSKAWTEYTKEELLGLSDDEFQKVVDGAKNGRSTPYQLLAVGMQRMNQENGSE
jgi:hypothetical protein